ncbi:hypothetical protein [Rubinisphaera italica]|uniref:hypothetical protein n=1 Tax=Rubinisphaera italica TaxID=2527969 RepID=UPI0011B42CA2|nr:hypothetical protein [Rubinisphaera italica]
MYEIINQNFKELSENDFQHPKVRRHTTRESNGGRDEYRRDTVFPASAEVKQLGWVDVAVCFAN